MVNKSNQEPGSNQISREAVDWLLRRIIHIPRNWLIISSIFILLSTFQITGGDKLTFKFQVTNTTAIFLSTYLAAICAEDCGFNRRRSQDPSR